MSANIFEQDLKVVHRDHTSFTASVGSSQRFGDNLHGGFAAALAAHTALEHVRINLGSSQEQRLVALQVQFLKTINRDYIELHVDNAKVGKSAVTLYIKLFQSGVLKLGASITVSNTIINKGISVDTGYRLSPEPVTVDFATLERNEDPKWICYHLFYDEAGTAHTGIPLSHWNIYFMRDGPVHPRLHDNWLSLSDPASRITNAALPIIADLYLRMADNWTPDSDFSYNGCVRRAERAIDGSVRQEDIDTAKMRSWSATESLSLEIVRELPPEGVKRVLLRAEGKSIKNGRLIAELMIYDEELRMLAIGQCTDLIIPLDTRPKETMSNGTLDGSSKL